MHQSIQAAQVDKETKIGNLAQPSTAHLTRLKLFQQLPATLSAPFFSGSLLRENQAPAPAIDFNDFEQHFLAHQGAQATIAFRSLSNPSKANELGHGDKTTQTPKFNRQPTAIRFQDCSFANRFIIFHLLGFEPVFLLLGLRNGQFHIAIVVAGLHDNHRDSLPNLEI
ncbi:MAG: hypothetical protein BWY63_03180 [Chloroflexi bacterium ADurb.Bin360]|nr:MAG: hypothetical protein BWY63_03180 [Chloroflexi bacterium ADurb.Bin360]